MYSIDHLGIAVKSLGAAKAVYEKLGLSVSPEETVEQEQVRLVMVPVGESRLELLEATSENSTSTWMPSARSSAVSNRPSTIPRNLLRPSRSPREFRLNSRIMCGLCSTLRPSPSRPI